MIGHEDQQGRRLRIVTKFDAQERGYQPGDPFLAVKMDGAEDISAPFSYTVEVLRSGEKPLIPAQKLVNTLVHIGVRVGDNADAATRYLYRSGVIEKLDLFPSHDVHHQSFHRYVLTVVPGFAMLSREILFRAFENMDVVAILKEVLSSAPNQRLNFDRLSTETFPIIPYCVQFGESSMNFASRLMAQFGIFYFFDHSFIGSDPSAITPENGEMVMGRANTAFPYCEQPNMGYKASDPSEENTSDYIQHVIPTSQFLRATNSNPLQPIEPITQAANVVGARDVLAGTTGASTQEAASHFRSEQFGVNVLDTDEAQSFAAAQMGSAQSGVFSASGTSQNATMVAGRLFSLKTTTYEATHLLSHLEIKAYELGYGYNVGTNLEDVFLGLFSPIFQNKKSAVDFVCNAASQSLSNWTQNQFPYQLQNVMYRDTQFPQNQAQAQGFSQNQTVPYFYPFVLGGAMAALISAVGGAVSNSVDQVIKSEGDDYGNSFHTLFWLGGQPRGVPLPVGVKPLAHGPHLAVVVGQTGVRTDGGATEIDQHADPLGRVRLRFAWQRALPPPAGQGSAAPEQTDPYRSDRVTCWARVSQAWAGVSFGWQFLPRVGEEVIVSFLDGDPDQPVVTGRVYHASPSTNLPFPATGTEMTAIDMDTLRQATGSSNFRFVGLKTHSTSRPKGSTEERYHLLRFDETYNEEQVLLRSQGRLDVYAFGSSYETTEGNDHRRVIPGKDKNGNTVGGSSFTTVGGELDLHVGKSRYEKIDKDSQLHVVGDTQWALDGNCTTIVGKALSLNADTIVMEANTKITLKVGCTTIVLNAGGVYLDGPGVYKQCGGSAGTAGDITLTNIADASLADPGKIASARQPASHGHAGPRGTTKVPAQHAPDCTLDPAHGICINIPQMCQAL